jgi:hypothetical protein
MFVERVNRTKLKNGFLLSPLLTHAYSICFSGTLSMVTSRGEQATIVFKEGLIHSIQTESTDFRLVDLLVENEDMSNKKMNQIFSSDEYRDCNTNIGSFLVKNKLVSKKNLEAAILRQISERLRIMYGYEDLKLHITKGSSTIKGEANFKFSHFLRITENFVESLKLDDFTNLSNFSPPCFDILDPVQVNEVIQTRMTLGEQLNGLTDFLRIQFKKL